MTVESDMFATLQGLVGGRVYPDIAPLTTAQPYLTYQQVGGESVGFLENVTPSKKNARFQVNAWGSTRAAVAALALQIEAAMVAATVFQARPLGAAIASFDGDTQIYGAMQDFTVWSER